MNRTYVALDLELTGLDPMRDEIIEIGLVRFQGAQVLETFSSLVNARRPVPLKIQQLVGIGQTDVDNAPALRSLYGKILAFVKSYPLVGHSIDTDLRFLARQGLSLNNLAIDTFELACILLPEARRYSLAQLAQFLNIPLSQSHRALADALTSKELLLSLFERATQCEPSILEEIERLAQNSDWPLRQFFADLVHSREENPQMIATSPSLGSTPKAPKGGRLSPAPLEPRAEPVPVDSAALAALISPGGLFAERLPGYEHRPQQVSMLEAVCEAFNTPAHLLVEAGTGTGKSLAYLLPAVYFATQNGQRVVISSNTINLQDQLFSKDIPDLQRILPVPFTAALLKGRNNYVCLRRLAALRHSRHLTAEAMRFLAKVLVWLPTTRSGDRAELTLINSDIDQWSQVQCDAKTCMGDLCAYRQRGECLFYRARAQAERAHLVVINHALLLSDIVLENRILPDYKYLVIDEAHHLEEQATEQFGLRVGREDIYAFLANLWHQGGDAPGGLLSKIPQVFTLEGVSSTMQQSITATLTDIQVAIERTETRLYELFNVLGAFLRDQVNLRKARESSYDQNIPLSSGLRTQPDWANVEIAWESYSTAMAPVQQGLERLSRQIEGLPLGENAARDELVIEIKAQIQNGLELALNLQKILLEPEQGGIYWISISNRDELNLNSAPLHIGPMLQSKLFDHVDSVVLTSATLRTGNSFQFIKSRLGLEDPIELAVDSPFDYQTAVLLYVPKDIPEPNQPNYQRTVEQAIADLCRATEGRTLALFTSNSQLNTTYRAVQAPLEQDDIVIFAQGVDGSRRQILENFRTTPKAVLMGTRSFWEGVDVVGEALSCLVIPRLPFAVPTDPVLSARAQTFDDPFNEYYLPDSILRFRQGFGRLIRSREDFGLVVVLDRRILTKAYGKTILRSLPPCTARQGPLSALPGLARRWLDRTQRQA